MTTLPNAQPVATTVSTIWSAYEGLIDDAEFIAQERNISPELMLTIIKEQCEKRLEALHDQLLASTS